MDILLVEDNPGDVRLAREALQDVQMMARLHVVSDGQKAISYLRKEGDFSEAVRPDLIILDLNLPRKDGREVLAEIKKDRRLRRIPVVVFTTSKAEQDVVNAYELHANCFISKAVDWDSSCDAVRSIQQFWLSTVTLPPQEE